MALLNSFLLRAMVGAALGCAALSANAEIYSCKDPATGKVITSDRPIPECARTDMRVLNADGSTKQVIAAPMNEQQRARALEEQKRADEAARALDEQRRRERSFLLTYKTEQDLVDAYVRQLSAPVGALNSSHSRIKGLRAELDKVITESEFYKGKPWPFALRRKLAEINAGLQSETRAINARADDIARVNQRFEEDRARYRELSTIKQRLH
jgi:hypothetical protein